MVLVVGGEVYRDGKSFRQGIVIDPCDKKRIPEAKQAIREWFTSYFKEKK